MDKIIRIMNQRHLFVDQLTNSLACAAGLELKLREPQEVVLDTTAQ